MQARKQDILLSTEFLEDSDPYKYARRWASKYSYSIKAFMIDIAPDRIAKDFPFAFFFIQSFMKQFQLPDDNGKRMGLKPKDIELPVIYRGVDSTFRVTDTFEDKGFVSFTGRLHVAEDFAKGDGHILQLKVTDLPPSSRAFLIDESIDPSFHEQEFLILPGTFRREELGNSGTQEQGKGGAHGEPILFKYKPNTKLIKSYLKLPTPILKHHPLTGGSMNKSQPASTGALPGKCIVFYRHIHGRAPEVLQHVYLPNDQEEVDALLRGKCRRLMETYRFMTTMIPEFQDLKASLEDKSLPDNEVRNIIKKLTSYYVEMALYDPYKKCVETLNITLDTNIFSEIFPDFAKRSSVIENAIIKYLK